MDIKYLSDGRKVIVLGKLNNQEMIVQEIFIDEQGNEIPSGESFTAKSLHDTPVQSWQMKEEERLEKRLQEIKQEIKEYEAESRKARDKLHLLRDVLKSTDKFIKLLSEKDLDIMTSFITGTIEYLVDIGYEIKKPINMLDRIAEVDWHNRYEGLKLISVLGKSNGDFSYRIHKYSDGSGSSREVYPFTKYEDAIEFIKEKAIKRINENSLRKEEYQRCIEMGIIFPQEVKEKYKNTVIEKNKKSINNIKKQMDALKDDTKQLEDEIKAVERE